MLSTFITRLRSIHPISDGLEAVLRGLEIIDVPKGTLLLQEGAREDYSWVILKGLTRTYYLSDDGEEVITHFNTEEQIVVSMWSFYGRTPATESIEALEDCTLARIHYDQLQRVYYDFPEFNFHARLLTQGLIMLRQQLQYLMRKKDAKERFDYFAANYPDWLLRVPAKHIATFLQMDEEMLVILQNTTGVGTG